MLACLWPTRLHWICHAAGVSLIPSLLFWITSDRVSEEKYLKIFFFFKNPRWLACPQISGVWHGSGRDLVQMRPLCHPSSRASETGRGCGPSDKGSFQRTHSLKSRRDMRVPSEATYTPRQLWKTLLLGPEILTLIEFQSRAETETE